MMAESERKCDILIKKHKRDESLHSAKYGLALFADLQHGASFSMMMR